MHAMLTPLLLLLLPPCVNAQLSDMSGESLTSLAFARGGSLALVTDFGGNLWVMVQQQQEEKEKEEEGAEVAAGQAGGGGGGNGGRLAGAWRLAWQGQVRQWAVGGGRRRGKAGKEVPPAGYSLVWIRRGGKDADSVTQPATGMGGRRRGNGCHNTGVAADATPTNWTLMLAAYRYRASAECTWHATESPTNPTALHTPKSRFGLDAGFVSTQVRQGSRAAAISPDGATIAVGGRKSVHIFECVVVRPEYCRSEDSYDSSEDEGDGGPAVAAAAAAPAREVWMPVGEPMVSGGCRAASVPGFRGDQVDLPVQGVVLHHWKGAGRVVYASKRFSALSPPPPPPPPIQSGI